jgi:hypothetical protein
VFTGGRGVALEAWRMPRVDARGTVVHGHAASKDSQLREAMVFHGIGLNSFLVDFYGSGGSRGNETSIGFYEALDVAKAFDYARDLPGSGRVVIYGASMGAAAVLKGVCGREAPTSSADSRVSLRQFDSLIGTVRHRFTTMGIPSFPLADLPVFWGGMRKASMAYGTGPSSLHRTSIGRRS